jgi:hypothetical protein
VLRADLVGCRAQGVRTDECRLGFIKSLQVKVKIKGKAVPLHAMEALGGRGGIAPTHSLPRH